MIPGLERSDPLGILSSTLPVVEHAGSVRIEPEAFPLVATRLRDSPPATPEWRTFPHWWSSDPSMTTMYVLVLDTLNHCFWGEPRWTVQSSSGSINGYYALAAALRSAIERNEPILNPAWLSTIREEKLTEILGGTNVLPLMSERAANLRELGGALIDHLAGSPIKLLENARFDAVEVVRQITHLCPSFNDVTVYDGQPVRFLKRAQILASDLAGALSEDGAPALTGLEHLTAFADYKVPQVLRAYGLISYAAPLAIRIDNLLELAPGSREEIEIRAATIWAVELLRRELAEQGVSVAPYEIDWFLWNLGQSLADPRPYHRTRTIYY